MKVGARGRQRDFDLDTTIHIAIMAELVQLGFGAPVASDIALKARNEKRLLLATQTFRTVRRIVGTIAQTQVFLPIPFQSELSEAFTKLANQYPNVPLPGAYVVIDVERIAARIKAAEEEWQQRGAVKGLGSPVGLVGPSAEDVDGGDATPSPKKTP